MSVVFTYKIAAQVHDTILYLINLINALKTVFSIGYDICIHVIVFFFQRSSLTSSNCRGKYSLIYKRIKAALNSKTDFKADHAIQTLRSADEIATRPFEWVLELLWVIFFSNEHKSHLFRMNFVGLSILLGVYCMHVFCV